MNNIEVTAKPKSATNSGSKMFRGNGYSDFFLSIIYKKIPFS